MAASSLAALAGFIDGVGFVYLGGFFVSFMTGNTTRLGVGAASLDAATIGVALLLIVSFVAGAAVGTVVSSARGAHGSRVLLLVTGALVVAGVVAEASVSFLAGALLAFAMGAMNTVFARGGDISFGVTYMTGALVKIGQSIARAFQGGDRLAWVRNTLLWAAIAVGAVLGASAYLLIGVHAIWIAVGVAAAMTAVAALRPPRPERREEQLG
ncbi:DUF1275 domain-containing protein [Agromyces atrinae]|uniref:YoaK family protein n=1 Tax=Agromyces atrinae TaxID=592376 RepID=UPI001F5639DA|nr:YoaK family protein [Agromyces atrinae]MCI2956434.1 DUF1275 domain-containing protein [Agromyces atrinae]